MSKKKAMTSEKASYVKRKGHEDAREFAIALGIGKEFRSDPIAKKDVIDENCFVAMIFYNGENYKNPYLKK
jgi:hypothetical protein